MGSNLNLRSTPLTLPNLATGSAVSPAGRPEIGQPINIRLGNELLAEVDQEAQKRGVSRAEAVRQLLTGRPIVLTDFERMAAIRAYMIIGSHQEMT